MVVKEKEFKGYVDPFYPVLTDSTSLKVSEEQKLLLREILAITSSDHQFAQKAYEGIIRVLTGAPPVPVVTSLVPNTAEIGDNSFTLHVHGTDFDESSVIYFAGKNEPTSFTSSKEVTTGVDMSVWKGADVLPVSVKNNGVASNSMNFTFVFPEKLKLKPTVETKHTEPKQTNEPKQTPKPYESGLVDSNSKLADSNSKLVDSKHEKK